MKSKRTIQPAIPAVAAALLLTGALMGCGGSDAPEPAAEEAGAPEAPTAEAPEQGMAEEAMRLAGTTWRLVEIQSMDDTQGTIRPADPSDFVMTLGEDGRVNMRLDCNRANGTWSAQPAPGDSSGTFTFGPLAGTRAMCPEPHIDQMITGQAEYIRGFLIRDGRLALTLMADGGIWIWEPWSESGGEGALSTTPDPALEAAILEAQPDYTAEVIGDSPPARYVHGSVDLDGDGVDEVFAFLEGPFFCGTGGCTLLLFSREGDGFRLVDDFPISRLPVYVSPSRTNGWLDLIREESGGGAPLTWVLHTFDGTGYVEAERFPQEARPEGTAILVGDDSYDAAFPLPPAG